MNVKDYVGTQVSKAAIKLEWGETVGTTRKLLLKNALNDILSTVDVDTENYLSFQGETEQPAAGEIIFADAVEQAHARRWVFRQSALSAVSAESDTVLLVAEAMHEDAGNDLHRLQQRILARAEELGHIVAKKQPA